MAGEWTPITLADVLSFSNGRASPDRVDGLPYPVYGSNGVIGFANEANSDSDTIVIGRVGSYCGSLYFSREQCWVTDNAIRANALDDNDARFLFYLLQTLDLNHWRGGSGQPLLNQAILGAIPASVPKPAEQCAIAHILGTLDDKIELNRRLNETLEAMARATFQSWFVDFEPARAKAEGRDPGLPKLIADLFPDRFKASELGKIPEGWSIRTLYDCADYVNGAAFRNEHFSPNRMGLPVIKIGELKDGITAQTKFTEHSFDERYRISDGEMLFSWSGSPDTSIDTFIWAYDEGWLNQHIFKIRFKRSAEKYFVYNLLGFLKPVFVEIARNKQTTGLGHVTATDLKRLKTVIPPEGVLLTFNRLAGPLFEKTFANLQESRTLATLRDALLPKLISGKLRVKETEPFIGRAHA